MKKPLLSNSTRDHVASYRSKNWCCMANLIIYIYYTYIYIYIYYPYIYIVSQKSMWVPKRNRSNAFQQCFWKEEVVQQLGEEIQKPILTRSWSPITLFYQIIIDYIPMKYQHKIKDQNSLIKKVWKSGCASSHGLYPECSHQKQEVWWLA